ncbi:MAG: hypothetical protein Q9160_000383 [Pyrenula sp. 1 TL-2023]
MNLPPHTSPASNNSSPRFSPSLGPSEFVRQAAANRRSAEDSAFVDTFPARPSDARVYNDAAPWKHHGHGGRPQSPSLPWHKDLSQLNPQQGRLLVIDFQKATSADTSKRKVIAREIVNLKELRDLYASNRSDSSKSLRLFHVQNAPWATRFLLKKFNIHNRDDGLVGTDFGKYARYKRPERRGGKPILTGKTWRVTHDPWRGIARTSFGIDYLKPYRVKEDERRGRSRSREDFEAQNLKMMEFNCYDEEDNPTYGYDIFVQRLSCYVQHKEREPPAPSGEVENPYRNGTIKHSDLDKQYVPKLDTLDNENAIIIFENSHSGSFEDTLIPARQEWEKHWRRLPFYLAYESKDIREDEDLLGLQCARMILDDVFKSVVGNWDTFLDIAQTHVGILEDKIYERPADETRAPELWYNSSSWLKAEKLLFVHMDIVKEMRIRLRELVDDIPDESGERESDTYWLEEIPSDLHRLGTVITEDLIKPTQALISLLYQSVSIRDSRHSLQLGTSMWRLSWITFVFLPLSFLASIYGMNVSLFEDNPSIKWYFIVAVPFMLLILMFWFLLKHILARGRQTPYQRGIYETFFHDMAVNFGSLWTRTGPRDDILPQTRMDKIRWALIKRWSRPEKTIRAADGAADGEGGSDDLGTWSRTKRMLIRQWTAQLRNFKRSVDAEAASLNRDYEGSILGSDEEAPEDLGIIADGVLGATEMLTVPGTRVVEESSAPGHLRFVQSSLAAQGKGGTAGEGSPGLRGYSPRGGERKTSSDAGRRSAERSSGVLVEEEDPKWLCELGQQGRGWWWSGRRSSKERGGSSRRGSGSGSRSRTRQLRDGERERPRRFSLESLRRSGERPRSA